MTKFGASIMHDTWTINHNPPGLTLFKLLKEDLRAHNYDPSSQGFISLAAHRILNSAKGLKHKALRAPAVLFARIFTRLTEYITGITITHDTKIMPSARIWHHGGIIINADYIGERVQIRQCTTIGEISDGVMKGRPHIETDCDIGCNCTIVGNIRLGPRVKVGAGSVVIKSANADEVIAGNPARKIGGGEGAKEV